MKKRKCIVIREEMSEKDILSTRSKQKNTATQNSRNGKQTAFSKALNGSKLYLKAQGYIGKTED